MNYFELLKRGVVMIWSIIGLLILLWILGFAFSIGGNLIHTLLVLAGIIFVFRLITGRDNL